MRILLFGSSGFIGRHVRAALDDAGELICPRRDRHDLVNGELDDLKALIRAERPDAVVCCVGALTGTPGELMRANAMVAAGLLESAPQARLVRLGSAGEYGVVPEGHAVAEDDRLEPVGAYGVSHAAGTRLFALASNTVSLRVFNPIGAGQPAENVLGRAAAQLRAGNTELTLGPLGAYRDFVDVRDVASLIRAVVVAGEVPHPVYNAGSGRAVTVREAVRLLAREAGFTGPIRERGAGPQRSAAVNWIQADITRAAKDLGWAPAHDLTDSIKSIWDAA
ncbi:NAD-dependent epimerase/dehydratase family protein [Paractinoplanes brasiliensis]|uniref:Nucleoside-diphosphate-sugar epimerase n=1 Tax=Paractinoplanes brasiliensis TaxID=52695 RepID=A0A4R6J7D4_9ACTN|nr:NAD(P)-dependent oxidoreductase [Actinoplanes brasiliensis]TDO31410.1 nucleoside-diphosphate-sugar epimerase [Actinoplanes brasiliensis]GID30806.1 snoG protein [Actinoplanes brasiliensis]